MIKARMLFLPRSQTSIDSALPPYNAGHLNSKVFLAEISKKEKNLRKMLEGISLLQINFLEIPLSCEFCSDLVCPVSSTLRCSCTLFPECSCLPMQSEQLRIRKAQALNCISREQRKLHGILVRSYKQAAVPGSKYELRWRAICALLQLCSTHCEPQQWWCRSERCSACPSFQLSVQSCPLPQPWIHPTGYAAAIQWP